MIIYTYTHTRGRVCVYESYFLRFPIANRKGKVPNCVTVIILSVFKNLELPSLYSRHFFFVILMKFLTSEWRERSKCSWGKLKGAQSYYSSFMLVLLQLHLSVCVQGERPLAKKVKCIMCDQMKAQKN